MTERRPMRASPSAYAALGLEPGADRAAVEQAYRRLIKLHHPDRLGGDAGRAAEINRAYFELRRQPPEPEPGPVAKRSPVPRRRSARKPRRRPPRRWWSALVLAAAALLLIERERVAEASSRWIASLSAVPDVGPGSPARVDSALLDGPLAEPAIAGSIAEARRLVRSGDDEAMAEHSRDCHQRMRESPELARLDRCASFDDAVAALADNGTAGDRFAAAAVTARQMTAASLLSGDYLAIERRLDRIRMTVQLALIPRVPQPQPRRIDQEPPAEPPELEPPLPADGAAGGGTAEPSGF